MFTYNSSFRETGPLCRLSERKMQMSIGRKISDAFYNVMDWAMEGNIVWSLTKLLGVGLVGTSILIGALASPLLFISSQNSRTLQDRIDSFDNRPTVVFNSVAQCTAKGFTQTDCLASKAEAEDIAGSLGTSISYGSASQCEAAYGACREVVTHGTMMVGKVMVPTTDYSYHPYVKAWQAAQDNLKESVPLYQSTHNGTLLRTDGAQIPAP